MVISRRRLHITRDGVLFVVGMIGIAHETFVSKVDRPGLLVLFAAMVGLPAFLQKDELSRDREDGRDQDG